MPKCCREKTQIFLIFLLYLCRKEQKNNKTPLMNLELLLTCTWFWSLKWLYLGPSLVNLCYHAVSKKQTCFSLLLVSQQPCMEGKPRAMSPWLGSWLEHPSTLLSQPLFIWEIMLGGSRTTLYSSFGRSVFLSLYALLLCLSSRIHVVVSQ